MFSHCSHSYIRSKITTSISVFHLKARVDNLLVVVISEAFCKRIVVDFQLCYLNEKENNFNGAKNINGNMPK